MHVSHVSILVASAMTNQVCILGVVATWTWTPDCMFVQCFKTDPRNLRSSSSATLCAMTLWAVLLFCAAAAEVPWGEPDKAKQDKDLAASAKPLGHKGDFRIPMFIISRDCMFTRPWKFAKLDTGIL